MHLKPGSHLQGGKYKIIRTLGQGGFGITYEAEQVLLKRKVALKEFFMKDCCERDETTSNVTVGTGSQKALVAKFKDKFIREAQMMAGMNHPNIVRVIDVFEENGTAYYVMEAHDGGSLKDKVEKEGPMTESQAVKYIKQVADALAYIHSRNTVHLDVKPSNVLLDENGDAVLIDFGISKHYDKSGEQTSSTPVGISKGYAPLEQSRDGDVSQFSPATDIYALGATLYYLVSGLTPPEASIIYEDGLSRPRGIPNRLWKTIEKAMQPRRKDRPQDIAGFLSVLGDQDTTIKTEKKVGTKPDSGSAENDDEDKTRVASEAGAPSQTRNRTKSRSTPQPPTPAPAPSPSHNSKPSASPKRLSWLWALLGSIVLGYTMAIVIGITKPKMEFRTKLTELSDPTGEIEGHGYVDLGLPSGLKWATCNVGSPSVSGYGDLYAWGETEPKSDFSIDNYKFYSFRQGYSKYNFDPEKGVVDNLTTLDSSDDVAHFQWGGTWRMPTSEEWRELLDGCLKKEIEFGGVKGYKFTSRTNGTSIFLPKAGKNGEIAEVGLCGYYYSSSLCPDDPDSAIFVSIFGDNGNINIWQESRWDGLSIRPVSE